MTPAEAGLLGFGLMIALVLMSVHVSFAIIISGFIGLAIIMGIEPALSSMAILSFERVTDYTFAVIPLFMLMSAFIANTDIGTEAYEMSRAWIGQAKGGLAMATVGATGLFAACTGSSMAGAIAMAKIAYPEMKRYEYEPKLALGTIAAGATLGILIPPSMGFILIGILTEISIGKLFIAGIIPGILEIIFYIVTIFILCRFNPQLGPAGPKTTVKHKIGSLGLTWPVVLLFILIIGGIYTGVFTAAEAGAIGAFGALVISLIKKQMTRSSFVSCLLETAQITGMMIALIIGAFIFKQFLAVTRVPFVFSDWVAALEINKYVIVAILVFVYIILGSIFDIYAIIVMTTPIIFPTMEALGFNPLWFGVIMVRLMEMGEITPPFGFNLFALSGSIREIRITDLYRGVIPFLIADILHISLLIAIPSLSTFLPEIMLER
jgi:C4-dicarboxylate transporter DctM subunit